MEYTELGIPAGATAAAAARYDCFGVSITNKGQLAMRGTTSEKYTARMRVFARDGDTKVVVRDLKMGYMHKSDAARILADHPIFAELCVAAGHDWPTVRAFLLRVAGSAVAVPVLPQKETTAAQAVPELETAVQEIVVQEEVQAAETQQVTAQEAAAEPGTTELLDQQEAADAGEAEEPEESVEASRKTRRRR
jgi:hypothetical protein